MEVISRKEALEKGLGFYFTGKPCKHGHVSKRRAKNRICMGCVSEIDHKKEYEKRRDHQLKVKAEYYEKNKDILKLKMKSSHSKNRSKRLASQREYYSRNKYSAFERAARRRSVIDKATPAWADAEKMRNIYSEASKLGLHVDHIVPLNSELVCGLHVENNMQLLSASENISKGNRYWPDMP